jgi:PPOX class probable F420-dependent enzyme
MRLSAERVERLLTEWPVARLATVAPDGRPHIVPIVFARHEGIIYSPVDGKPKSGRELARVRHVRADPRVSLLLDDYDRDWTRLWWLRADGIARILEAPAADAPELAAPVAALRAKYPQYRDVPVLRDPPTLLAIELTPPSTWSAATWGRS